MSQILVSKQTIENCDRFNAAQVAGKYPSAYRQGNRRDQREKDAILRCVSYLPKGGHVLDFPCGTGRLLNILKNTEFRVSGADAAEAMLALADENTNRGAVTPEVALYQRDVFNSGFQDNEFDAVVCNRLFHHFKESDDRKRALSELRRISKGPLIISFFNSFSLSMSWRRFSKALRGKPLRDRVPVSLGMFANEARECGLKIIYKTASRWGGAIVVCGFGGRR